jgi:ketosteroid isomerase-like protein
MAQRSVLVAALTALLATACAAYRPVPNDDHRELLDQRQEEFTAAVAARDADRTAELFAEDAVLHIANRAPIEGNRAIRQFYGNVFGFMSASRATPETTRLAEGGDMAYGIGRTSNEFRGPDGPVEYTGKYLLVWRKIAGDWRIVAYSLSSNQPEGER